MNIYTYINIVYRFDTQKDKKKSLSPVRAGGFFFALGKTIYLYDIFWIPCTLTTD